jgi:carbamoyltransferase
MLTLGINDGHNSSACLYRDGRLAAAVGEERLRRTKNWTGFPEKALFECLRIAGCRMEDVDYFAIAGLGKGLLFNNREDVIAMYRNQLDRGVSYWQERFNRSFANAVYKGSLRNAYRSTGWWAARDRRRTRTRVERLLAMGVSEEKIVNLGHHLAHASSAYYGWGRFDEDILVLTNDGSGDRICATVNLGRNGKLECLAEVNDSESLGFIYSMTTTLLGMIPLEHEHKLMGMAPYADQRASEDVCAELKAIFDFQGEGGLTWRRRNGCPETYCSYRYLQNLFDLRRFDLVCGGLQRFTEEFVSEWVRNCIKATGVRKVALSGGLFMNVKLNKIIMQLPEVEELFVFPSCGDESNAMGGAYYAYARHSDYRNMQPLADLYLGAEFSDEEIGEAIRNYPFTHPVEVERCDRIEERASELLAEGQVVARFKGREEFGARALGNRSILADPSRPEVVEEINRLIKSRDFWMPFAPSVLDRRQHDYFHNPKRVAAPYMMLTFDSTDRFHDIQAACHRSDRTLRPQVVYRDWNPDYYALLEAFEQRTSFNLHGYPIVSNPVDALHVFDESGLFNLAIGSYLLKKQI